MTFYVERHNGISWTCMLAAEHYVNPTSIQGPPESNGGHAGLFPPARTPGNASAFAGLPGYSARVRFDDDVLELYAWEKVPESPNDPNSNMVWGWRLLSRAPAQFSAGKLALAELSVF